MSRQPLEIRDVAQGQVNFSTGGPLVWLDEAELEGTRGTVRRFGVAYVKGNAIDEADLAELHKAIRGDS